MKNINTHGHKINIADLITASKETTNLPPLRGYYEMFYDRSDGAVWAKFHSADPCNSWTRYHSNTIIRVGATTRHVSAQAIADMIDQAIEMDKIAEEALEQERREREAFEAWVNKAYAERART